MLLWWLGTGVLLAVVVPIVVALLVAVLRPALDVRRRVGELADIAEELPARVGALEDLQRTPGLLDQVQGGLERYAAAVEAIVAERRT